MRNENVFGQNPPVMGFARLDKRESAVAVSQGLSRKREMQRAYVAVLGCQPGFQTAAPDLNHQTETVPSNHTHSLYVPCAVWIAGRTQLARTSNQIIASTGVFCT